MPTPRASAKLKRRMLGARLHVLAERHVRELEESACVDPVKLGEALELLNMARLAAQPRRRPKRRPGEMAPEEASRPITQLCVGGVDFSRAPRAAVEDFLANREWPREDAGRRRSGRGSRREREHAWLMERRTETCRAGSKISARMLGILIRYF